MPVHLLKLAHSDVHWFKKLLLSPHLSFGLSFNQVLDLLSNYPQIVGAVPSASKAILSYQKNKIKPKRNPVQPLHLTESENMLMFAQENEAVALNLINQHSQNPILNSSQILHLALTHRCVAKQLAQNSQWLMAFTAHDWTLLIEHHPFMLKILLRNPRIMELLSGDHWVKIAKGKPEFAWFLYQQNKEYQSAFSHLTLGHCCQLAQSNVQIAKDILRQKHMVKRLTPVHIQTLAWCHEEVVYSLLRNKAMLQKLKPKHWLTMALAGPEVADKILKSKPTQAWLDHSIGLYRLSLQFIGIQQWLIQNPDLVRSLSLKQQKSLTFRQHLLNQTIQALHDLPDHLPEQDPIAACLTPYYHSSQAVNEPSLNNTLAKNTKRNNFIG